jgi:hypothetical protein
MTRCWVLHLVFFLFLFLSEGSLPLPLSSIYFSFFSLFVFCLLPRFNCHQLLFLVCFSLLFLHPWAEKTNLLVVVVAGVKSNCQTAYVPRSPSKGSIVPDQARITSAQLLGRCGMSAAGFLGGVVAIVRAVRAAVKEGKCTAA